MFQIAGRIFSMTGGAKIVRQTLRKCSWIGLRLVRDTDLHDVDLKSDTHSVESILDGVRKTGLSPPDVVLRLRKRPEPGSGRFRLPCFR